MVSIYFLEGPVQGYTSVKAIKFIVTLSLNVVIIAYPSIELFFTPLPGEQRAQHTFVDSGAKLALVEAERAALWSASNGDWTSSCIYSWIKCLVFWLVFVLFSWDRMRGSSSPQFLRQLNTLPFLSPGVISQAITS